MFEITYHADDHALKIGLFFLLFLKIKIDVQKKKVRYMYIYTGWQYLQRWYVMADTVKSTMIDILLDKNNE
jgi:hypothetical protein